MAHLEIDPSKLDASLANMKRSILKRVVNSVAVAQMDQVGAAFRDGGQPGKPWKKLWANSFVGKIAWHLQGALINAQSAMFKAVTAKTLNPMRIGKAMKRVEKANERALPSFSYRNGGEPLKDNGVLASSFFIKNKLIIEDVGISQIASSSFYGSYHQEGFKTKGPNFIPLSLMARRIHSLGANPADEGLEEGVDYVMAWKGVNVPQRKIIDYDNPTNKELIRRAIIDGAKG